MSKPLAERMRPQNLEAFVGQEALVGPNGSLTRLSNMDPLPSIILWGPPGSGKTSLAKLIAKDRDFHTLSAVSSGVQDLRRLLSGIKNDSYHLVPVLFLDEIHRWSKSQQDSLLPEIEAGHLSLIGATTENPSFSLIAPLLSRCRVFVLKPHSEENIRKILVTAWSDSERGLGRKAHELSSEILDFLTKASNYDLRWALNSLELLGATQEPPTLESLKIILGSNMIRYDKSGEAHYDNISALIKSLRASDPDAALFYFSKMFEAGEDPLYLCRRMIIFASEDIGNADPRALELSLSATEAYERIGDAEGWIPLSQLVCYLAGAPKSRASYEAYKLAKDSLASNAEKPIPMHLRNAPTKLMRELGYGKKAPGSDSNFPEGMEPSHFYQPTQAGYEKTIRERLEWIRAHKT